MEEKDMSGFKIMDGMLTYTANISHGLSNLIEWSNIIYLGQ